MRNYEDITKNKTELVLDARGPGEFNKVNEITGERNHIPNSINVPYNELFDLNTGLLKTKEELLRCILKRILKEKK